MSDREVSGALIRRIEAAAFAASANRFEVEIAGWPECHKRGCKEHHPDPREAMGLLQHAIISAIGDELRYEATTLGPRYDEDSPREAAWFALATLLNRYNVHHTGTFRRAAELIVDAYPTLIPALACLEDDVPVLCRDCSEGKHGACIGSAFVENGPDIDEVACGCPDAVHGVRDDD